MKPKPGREDCPARDVANVLKPRKREKLVLGSDENWKIPETEIQAHYKIYENNRPEIITRKRLFEDNLHAEIAQKYFNCKNRVDKTFHDDTEYKDSFGQIVYTKKIRPPSDFPIDDTEPITYWNPKGVKPTPFKRRLRMTDRDRYDVQFG